MIVGNDVVDLSAPRTVDRHRDPRFVARIFTDEEVRAMRASPDPGLALWRAWAAKEAAYKAVSKALGSPPVFAHRRFEVTWDRNRPVGMVRWEGWSVPVWRAAEDPGAYVHVLAYLDAGEGAAAPAAPHVPPEPAGPAVVERLDRPDAPWAGSPDLLLRQLTDAERRSVHAGASGASAAVRIGARDEAARFLDLPTERVEIVCAPGPYGRTPPAVLVDGAPSKVDVSLSHDGPWIAWALSRL